MKICTMFLLLMGFSDFAKAQILTNSEHGVNSQGKFVKVELPYTKYTWMHYTEETDKRIRGNRGPMQKYAADIVAPANSNEYAIFESLYDPNSQNVWAKFDYINVTQMKDGKVKAATTCDRDVENRFLINNQKTSCYTLNEDICTAFVNQIKSKMGNDFSLEKLAQCSEISSATNLSFELMNKITKNSENSRVAEAGMKRAINYANDLSKEVIGKTGIPWKTENANGKFEAWALNSKFDSAGIAHLIASKCYRFNLVSQAQPVPGVDYQKAKHEQAQPAR